MRKVVIAVAITTIIIFGFLFHPVCVPISDEDLKSFNIPIDQRTDRDFYLKVFQKKNGHWCQCKTWISRFFFF